MEKQYKVVLLGEGRVGKTSIVCRYCRDEFNAEQPSTVQATFLQKHLMANNSKITLNIWVCIHSLWCFPGSALGLVLWVLLVVVVTCLAGLWHACLGCGVVCVYCSLLCCLLL